MGKGYTLGPITKFNPAESLISITQWSVPLYNIHIYKIR